MLNMLDSGIYVVTNHNGASVGKVTPVINMKTYQGRITAISGSLIQTDTSGWFYNWQVSIPSGLAAPSYLWPSSPSGFYQSHDLPPFQNGIIFKQAASSGAAWSNGGLVPKSFGRDANS